MFADIGSLRPRYCTTNLLSPLSTGFRRRLSSHNQYPRVDPRWILSQIKHNTVLRKGNSGEQPSVGFAPFSGVNYRADGNAIIPQVEIVSTGGLELLAFRLLGMGMVVEAVVVW